MIGLKMVGRRSLIIYFIVSACCLVPEASFQLDHLKVNAFKASQQFILFIFGSHHDRVKIGGPDESYHLFYGLCLLFRSWSIISIWPFETQCIQNLTTIHTVYFWGHTLIGLKMVGRMSLIIYFIVSACCLGPDASLQLDHLKLNEFKASQQFIQFIFWSLHDNTVVFHHPLCIPVHPNSRH